MSARTEFIQAVKENLKLTKCEAERISDTVIDTLIECVIKNGEVPFPKKFKVKLVKRKPRIQKNIVTGESYSVPEKKTFKITLRKELHERLNPTKK